MSEDLVAKVRRRLSDDDCVSAGSGQVARLVRAESAVVGDAEVAAAVRRVNADVTGFGPLDDLLGRPGVTDVLVNGPDEVWIDDGSTLTRVDVSFPDEESVRRTAQRLLASAGRRVDLAHPFVDAQLPGGLRLHVVLPPISRSTVLSLRVPRRRAFSMRDLERVGTVDGAMAAALRRLVEGHVSFLVTGGTGAGKTTVLASLLGSVSPSERLVIIEDTAELRHSHPHAVHLQSRAANSEGAGAVTMADLVRQALRMRPDRIVVGEARGAEVVDLLGALNTGHSGSASTVHANAPQDVVARFAALGTLAGVSGEAVERQLAAAIGAVVHVERDAAGRRFVAVVAALTWRNGCVVVEPAVTAPRAGAASARGPGWAELAGRLRA